MKLAYPGIVIGLGGTGQWVLTYLKKNLLDAYGDVPETVRLLAFDTTGEQTEASVTAEKSASRSGEERARVGNVRLAEEEFIYLGGNVRGICERIHDENRHKHIGSWLQANHYLASFDDDAYEISKGAGQRRPFGRIAVFYDLATGSPKITFRLNQAINDVMMANQRQQPIEFYIITSVAGGTGSGMFIDMAHIVRKVAEAADVAFAIRGFIVQQNTFDPVTKMSSIELNAFAAMRELDRFMLVFDRDYPIYYSERPREPLSVYHSIYKNKLFDSCHLIDAVGPSIELRNTPPTLGVFPAIADCVTAFLDPEMGNTYFQHYKNVSNETARVQRETGKAVYSSIGTHTYILPVLDMIDRNTYKAAISLLRDYLLKIEQDPSDKKLRVSSTGNPETDRPPREEAKSFLQAEKSRMGLQNLYFSQQVALLLESRRLREQDFIDDVADAGIEMLTWVLPPVQDEMISDVSNSIQAIFETTFVAEVPNSKVYGDGTSEAAGRIKTQIWKMREELLGREDASGNRTQGDLQEGLLEFQKRNVKRFRRLLIEKQEDILNGTTDDPMKGKTGKLPYARDFAGWLVQAFDEFIVFMRAVVRERADSGELSLAREDALTTKQMMNDTRNQMGLLDRLRGTAVNAQNQYIGAESYLLDLERQEVLYQSVLSTAKALKAVASEAKAQCDHWLNVLALGGPVEGDERDREIGVYNKLLNEQGDLQRRREEQARIKVHRYLSGPGSAVRSEDDYKYEDELYSRLIGEKWPNILRRFSWEFEEIGGGLYLNFKYGDEELAAERGRQGLATDMNARFLLEKLRPYFYDVRNETIADRMEYLFTAQQAAKNLRDNSGPMISYAAHEQKMSEKRNFVCVNRGMQIRYFDDVQAAFRENASHHKDIQIIGSTNRHRCVVLTTVDLLTGEDTAPYRSARRSYKEYRGNRKMLQVFPAEVHASGFEQRLPHPPLYETARVLDPALAALLEDQDMVRRFVLSLFYDLVREEEVEGEGSQTHYVLRLDRQNRWDRTAVVRLTRSSLHPQLLDAMKAFVSPKIIPESDKREIWDVISGSAIRVEPSRIDEALEMREESVLSGREVIVDDLKDTLPEIADGLTAEGQNVLPRAFRIFLSGNEQALMRSESVPQTEEKKDSDHICQALEQFLDDNDDCYKRSFRSEIQEELLALLNRYRGGQNFEPISRRSFARRIERYINERPDEQNRRKGVIEQLRRSKDQTEQDLGAILLLVLWDKMERLQGLDLSVESHPVVGSHPVRESRDRLEKKHPLRLMAERFLHQAGLDITLFRQRIIHCRINSPTLKYLLPDTVYVHIRPDETLDSESVLSIYKRTRQIDLAASVVFVITDQGLADQGWAQIGTLRMKQFAVLPIDQSLMSKGLAEKQESSVLRNEVEKRLGTDYDPYDERDPVADIFSFFGRDGLIDTVLRHNDAGRHVGIFGLRKLGKSSLLRVLRDRAVFPVALVNLQTLNPKSHSLRQLYLRVLRYWSQWSLVRYDLDLEVPSLGNEDPTGAFVSATVALLDHIDRVTGEAHLGLFLDEVELIVPRPDGSGPDLQRYLTLMRAIRGLVDEDGRLSLVVASLNPSITRINRWDAEQNPTFNLLQEIYLPPLAKRSCSQMIRNIGRQIGLVYDDESVEMIADLSGGHPFLARQFCSLLYQQRGRQPGQIKLDAIPSAIERFIYDEQTVTHLDAGIWQDAGNASLWGESQAPINQAILLGLARAGEPLSEAELTDATDGDVRRTALINLERFHFVHQPEPGYYDLRYGLLRIWLRRRKLGLE